MIDVSAIVPWLNFALAAAALIYSIINNRAKDTSNKFEAVELKIEEKADRVVVGTALAKLDLTVNRVTVVENELKHLPDKDSTHRLETMIGEMRAEMRGLTEKVKTISAMADRIQEAILEKVVG